MTFNINASTFSHDLWKFKEVLAKGYPLVLKGRITVTLHWLGHVLAEHSLLELIVRQVMIRLQCWHLPMTSSLSGCLCPNSTRLFPMVWVSGTIILIVIEGLFKLSFLYNTLMLILSVWYFCLLRFNMVRWACMFSSQTCIIATQGRFIYYAEMLVFKMSSIQMVPWQWGSLKMLRHTESLNREMLLLVSQVYSKGNICF